MTFAELRALIEGAGIEDVIVPGFVDPTEKPLRFYALYRAVFIECGGSLLQFSSIGDTARMLVSKVESLTCYADVAGEEWDPAFASVKTTVMDDPAGTTRISTMHFWSG